MFNPFLRKLFTVLPLDSWPLNDVGTVNAISSGGTRLILTTVGTPLQQQATNVTGQSCFTFNGTSQRLGGNVGSPVSLALTTGTTGCSFRCTGGTTEQWLCGWENGGGSFSAGLYLEAGTGFLCFRVLSTAGNQYTIRATSANLRDSVWHTAAAVQDGTGIKLYVDGILQTTADSLTGTAAVSWWNAQMSITFYSIGGMPTLSRFFTGSIFGVFQTDKLVADIDLAELFQTATAATPTTSYRYATRRILQVTAPPVQSDETMSFELGIASTAGHVGWTLEQAGAPGGTLTPDSDSLAVINGNNLRELDATTASGGTMEVLIQGVGLLATHFKALVYQRNETSGADLGEWQLLRTSAATTSAYTLVTSGLAWAWSAQTYRFALASITPKNVCIVL